MVNDGKTKGKRGGFRPGSGRKSRFPGGSAIIRVPNQLKDKIIALLDLYGECMLGSQALESRADETTRKMLVEDMKTMIEFEKNRQEERMKTIDDRRQQNLF